MRLRDIPPPGSCFQIDPEDMSIHVSSNYQIETLRERMARCNRNTSPLGVPAGVMGVIGVIGLIGSRTSKLWRQGQVASTKSIRVRIGWHTASNRSSLIEKKTYNERVMVEIRNDIQRLTQIARMHEDDWLFGRRDTLAICELFGPAFPAPA